jgi:hypothetical protein
MTVLTDYALAAVALALSWRLTRASPSKPARLWAAAFAALAAAAVAGGTWHAIPRDSWPDLRRLLWSATYVAIGLADLLLLAGAAVAVLAGRARRVAIALACARFLVYVPWLLARRDFTVVALEFAVTLVLLAALGLALLWRREPAALAVLSGAAVTLAGGLALALRVSPHPQFNNNDLFHVVQMAGLWLFFRGALLLRDHGAPIALPVPALAEAARVTG